jgi:hypothetical protein
MYVNAKMIPVESIPRIRVWGEGRKEETGRGGEFKYDIFDTLSEFVQMPQCTPTQNNKRKKYASIELLNLKTECTELLK